MRKVVSILAITMAMAGGAAVVSTPAYAAPDPDAVPFAAPGEPDGVRLAASSISVDEAATLVAELGETRTGGTYLNRDGQLVVAVTDQAAVSAVRAAGGVPKLVTYSTAHLESVNAQIAESLFVGGTSRGVDPDTNQVSIEIDETVTGERLARVKEVTAPFGDAVRVERIPGRIEFTATTIRGGTGISRSSGGTNHCSAGFNVRDKATGERFMLTAGHCLRDGYDGRWYQTSGDAPLGRSYGWCFDHCDWGYIDYRSDVNALGVVKVNSNNIQQITHAERVEDGQGVDRAGHVSDDLRGMVLLESDDIDAWFGGELHRLEGMIKTSLCARSGDSGGALFAGTAALGITSAATGVDQPCNSGEDGRSWYQPVQDPLSSFVMEIY